MSSSLAEILLVEDEADDAELLIRALVEMRPGTRVAVIDDGVEALRQLLADDQGAALTPKLIILDLKLPGLNGIEVLRCLTADARTAKIPVVILSGTCSPEDVGASRSYGAKACMRKPSSGGDLRQVAKVLAGELH
ncbi:MAG: response regulator [Burkholderiales bacterium]|nr:response regulator [Burkholderiales bacterium]